VKNKLLLSANILVVILLIVGYSGFGSATAATQTLMSLDSAGDQGNGQLCGQSPMTSSDGRYVAFGSNSTNLVSGGTISGRCNIYLRDTQASTTTLESVSTSGVQANQSVTAFTMSRNARYLLFATTATNLDDGTTTYSGGYSIYLRDTQNNTTQVVVGSSYYDNYNFPAVSEDGRFIYYREIGYPTSSEGLFVKDMLLGTTMRVDAAADGTQENTAPSSTISTDCSGRFAVFNSSATNLSSDGIGGLFLVETVGSSHTIQKIANDGSEAQLTCDGDHVVFNSTESDLVSGDTNGMSDVFEYDIARGTYTMVSTDASGNEYSSSCSSASPGCPDLETHGVLASMDGRYVVMEYGNSSSASEWVKDTYTGALTEISQTGSTFSAEAGVTADARETYYRNFSSGQPQRLYVATDYL